MSVSGTAPLGTVGFYCLLSVECEVLLARYRKRDAFPCAVVNGKARLQ